VNRYGRGSGVGWWAAIPPRYFSIPDSPITCKVSSREINAFALPGGPMYVNRGDDRGGAPRVKGRRNGARDSATSAPPWPGRPQKHAVRRGLHSWIDLAGRAVSRTWGGLGTGSSSRRRASAWSRLPATAAIQAAGRHRRLRSWRAPGTTRATWPNVPADKTAQGSGGPEWRALIPIPVTVRVHPEKSGVAARGGLRGDTQRLNRAASHETIAACAHGRGAATRSAGGTNRRRRAD